MLDATIHHPCPRYLFQYSGPILIQTIRKTVFPSMDEYYKDKTVMRPFYLYNRNLYTGKTTSLYIETTSRPMLSYQHHYNCGNKMVESCCLHRLIWLNFFFIIQDKLCDRCCCRPQVVTQAVFFGGGFCLVYCMRDKNYSVVNQELSGMSWMMLLQAAGGYSTCFGSGFCPLHMATGVSCGAVSLGSPPSPLQSPTGSSSGGYN